MKNPFKRKKGSSLKAAGRCFVRLLSRLGGWTRRLFARLTGDIQRRVFLSKLQQGDIILASPATLKLSAVNLMYRFLLKARYVHSMLYLGGGKIIHTTAKKGVQIADVPKKVFRKAHYNVFRLKDIDKEQRKRVTAEALKLRGHLLDPVGMITNVPARLFGLRKPLLKLEQNRLWCAKLIYRAYSAAGIELVPLADREVVTSEDISGSPLLYSISYKS